MRRVSSVVCLISFTTWDYATPCWNAIQIVPLPFCLVEWKCLLGDLHVNGENWAYAGCVYVKFLINCVKAFCSSCFLLHNFSHSLFNAPVYSWVHSSYVCSRVWAYFIAAVCKLWIIYMQIFMICLDESDAYMKFPCRLKGKQAHRPNG